MNIWRESFFSPVSILNQVIYDFWILHARSRVYERVCVCVYDASITEFYVSMKNNNETKFNHSNTNIFAYGQYGSVRWNFCFVLKRQKTLRTFQTEPTSIQSIFTTDNPTLRGWVYSVQKYILSISQHPINESVSSTKFYSNEISELISLKGYEFVDRQW